jgi:hypothetical protein
VTASQKHLEPSKETEKQLEEMKLAFNRPLPLLDLRRTPDSEVVDNLSMDIYFSDYFKVAPETIEAYGAFNISLVADLPLFIDPFLLFNIYVDFHCPTGAKSARLAR